MENVNAILFAKMEEIHKDLREFKNQIQKPTKSKLLTISEKCNELGKSRPTLWRYVRDGKLDVTYVAGKVYFKPENS